MLEINNLQVHYGKITALHGVSLKVEQGEIVALIGANGSGKSTILKALSGLLPSRKGDIFFQGKNINTLPAHKIAKSGLIQIPEGRRIFPLLTVEENLLMGAFSRKDTAAIEEDLDQVLSSFPVLKERLRQLGGTLSGGEQQMLAFGRALMSRPRLLTLDEPSMGLAPVIVNKVFEIIREINKKGVTILLVEQNARAALSTASRGYVMETGNIVLEGKTDKLLKDDQVKRCYLGMQEGHFV